MPQYIFIYNQAGVGPNSRDDLKLILAGKIGHLAKQLF